MAFNGHKTKTDLADPMGMDVNQDEASIGPGDMSMLPAEETSEAPAEDTSKEETEESTDAEPSGETPESEAKEFIDKFVDGLEESYELEYIIQAAQAKLDAKGGSAPTEPGV